MTTWVLCKRVWFNNDSPEFGYGDYADVRDLPFLGLRCEAATAEAAERQFKTRLHGSGITLRFSGTNPAHSVIEDQG